MRDVTIFADRQIDRSPCGTGTSARAATLYERNELKISESFAHESITNGVFRSKVISEVEVDDFDAVVTTVAGTARITGFHQFVVDDRDEMPEGFMF